MFNQQWSDQPPQLAACGFCGVVLGEGYHFNCHLCGANYCYNHSYHHKDAHRCFRCGKRFPPREFAEHLEHCNGKGSVVVAVTS